MPPILSFIGAKGGTLKTASAAAVAHVLAKAGLRVVMVDLDPQGDLTTRSSFSRVADPLTADAVHVHYEGEPELPLWLLRGGRSMEAADMDAIQRHLERTEALDPDLVVIDTPPALGPATRAAAAAATFVIIPSEPGKESLMRAHDVITIATDDGRSPVIRILLTKANVQTNLYRWMVDNVDELYPKLRSRYVVPHETAAAESAVFDRPVTVSAPKSRSAQAYCDVAAEVIGSLGIESRSAVAGGVA
ncbi:MAG TPA: ParA family protein [Longimicrobiaceae bacterium]|nr:ParA family protein [Longimicrobiaceae bacterium]